MSDVEPTLIHADIEAFLRRAACAAQAGTQDLQFWHERPVITAAEIQMLEWLANAPACTAAIACRLRRDEAATEALLAGLTAIGIVEAIGGRYQVTDATRLYLRAHLGR